MEKDDDIIYDKPSVKVDNTIRYMPNANTQPVNPDGYACRKALLFELSHSMYGSWGKTWNGILAIPEHVGVLSLLLWVIETALESEATWFIETVRTTRNTIYSYRIWVLLEDHHNINSYRDFVMCASKKLTASRRKKRKREKKFDAFDITPLRIETVSDFIAAVQLYTVSGAIKNVDLSPIYHPNANHLYDIFSPEANFTRHAHQYGVDDVIETQRYVDAYLYDVGINKMYRPPGVLIDVGDIREIPYNFISRGRDIFDYYLPDVRPGNNEQDIVRERICGSSGMHSFDANEFDVTAYTTNDDNNDYIFDTSMERILHSCYYVLHNVKTHFVSRFDTCIHTGGDITPILRDLVSEWKVLFSKNVAGVPNVYTMLKEDFRKNVHMLRIMVPGLPAHDAYAANPIIRATREMFWNTGSSNMSSCGNVLASIMIGLSRLSWLVPPQRNAGLFLFCSAFEHIEDRVGESMEVVLCGPRGGGKSKIINEWADGMPPGIIVKNDGESSKVFTFFDPDKDMRFEVKDEMDDSLLKDVARRTQRSDGVSEHTRLVIKDGDYKLEKTKKVGRVYTAGNTNYPEKFRGPEADRITWINVPVCANIPKSKSASTMAATGDKVKLYRTAFSQYRRALVCLQCNYWSFHAMGAFEYDESMTLAYKCIMNTYSELADLSPRQMATLKRLSLSIMVMDLCCQWYRTGVGLQHNFDLISEVMFYRANSVVRMEHVVAAAGILFNSTSNTKPMHGIENSLFGYIETDDKGNPIVPHEFQSYYRLKIRKSELLVSIQNENSDLGEGLVTKLLSKISKECTRGVSNIKFDVNDHNRDVVLIGREYACKLRSLATVAIIETLIAYTKKYPDEYMESTCEEFVVFPSSVRCGIISERSKENNQMFPLLSKYTSGQITLAYSLLREREDVINRKKVKIVQEVSRGRIHKFTEGGDTIEREEYNYLQVHKSLLKHNQFTGSIDEAYLDLFRTALSIAGGYNNKEVVTGFNVGCDDILTVKKEDGPCVVIDNPLYINDRGIGFLMDPGSLYNDPLFPRTERQLTWTACSKIESICMESR